MTVSNLNEFHNDLDLRENFKVFMRKCMGYSAFTYKCVCMHVDMPGVLFARKLKQLAIVDKVYSFVYLQGSIELALRSQYFVLNSIYKIYIYA